MGSKVLRQDVQDFQSAVMKLSRGIGQASSLWNDSKFDELNSSVSALAAQTKDLMVLGDRCCESIDRFDKIADETY